LFPHHIEIATKLKGLTPYDQLLSKPPFLGAFIFHWVSFVYGGIG
jgi:hypothetical protein